MGKNENLNKAKKAKADEFYTRLEDIEKEVVNYKEQLKGLWVYCPCDDYRWSNFWKYFYDNFKDLELKRLTATNYDIGDGAFRADYDGENVTVIPLDGDGDFRSQECTKIKDECDIIITNPPFSLFREYIAQLMEYGKKFIIMGNGNAITYKDFFPYIKNNEIWLGYTLFVGKMPYFQVPLDTDISKGNYYYENGKLFKQVNSICWFTNLDHAKRNKPIGLYKHYSNEYKHYDNYDAIEVSKVCEIPMDYDGVMGVPITFLDKYCPDQFEIVGITENADYLKPLYIENYGKYHRPYIDGKCLYARILIRHRK